MNIREIVGFDNRYATINREERNYAAILYHALLQPGNAAKFLRFFGLEEEVGPDFGIYYEYAFLRDLWRQTTDNKTRRDIIRGHLHVGNLEKILSWDVATINTFFGVAGKPSETDIQYPGNWSIQKYHKHFSDSSEFLKVCRFKWSFNIKPDIVIHLSNDRAICIEAKYDSGEGQYPGAKIEKDIFTDRDLGYVGQLELQQYMMNELLGIDTSFVYLVQKKSEIPAVTTITWREAFEAIGFQSDFPFLNDFLKTCKSK